MQETYFKSMDTVLFSLLLVVSGIQSLEMRNASELIFKLINAYRANMGLRQMKWDEKAY